MARINSYIRADVVAGQERDSYAPGGAHAILVFKSCPCDDPGPGVTHTLGFFTFLWLHHEMLNSFLIFFPPDDGCISVRNLDIFGGRLAHTRSFIRPQPWRFLQLCSWARWNSWRFF